MVDRDLVLRRLALLDTYLEQLTPYRGIEVAETGAETFDILAEAELLPKPLGSALASMVGFRNILVHDYARLDPALVVGVLQRDLHDLERFRDGHPAVDLR